MPRAQIIASLNASLGNAYLETGETDKAFHYFKVDQEIATQQDDTEAKSRALSNLGRLYSRQHKYQKAIDR